MEKNFEKARGVVGKGMKDVKFTVPIAGVKWTRPQSVSDKGFASFVRHYAEFEIEYEGVTLPVNAKISLYVSPKNWQEFKRQIEGRRERAKLEKSDKDARIEQLEEQLAAMQALLKKLASN